MNPSIAKILVSFKNAWNVSQSYKENRRNFYAGLRVLVLFSPLMARLRYIAPILLLILLQSCGQKKSNSELDKIIVLVNYKTVDRSTIANGIQLINKCNPKIIGMEKLLITKR